MNRYALGAVVALASTGWQTTADTTYSQQKQKQRAEHAKEKHHESVLFLW